MSEPAFKLDNNDEPLGPDPVVPPDWFLRYLRSALNLPIFSVPKQFESWMVDRVATSGFDLPISQVIGFTQFTAQAAPLIGTSQSTTSTTFTDLATVGPTLTGLSGGEYVVMFGCQASTATPGNIASMAISANGAALGTPPIGDDCESRVNNLVSVARITTVSLPDGSNTLTAKYATDNAGATAFFSSRWLIALRYSN